MALIYCIFLERCYVRGVVTECCVLCVFMTAVQSLPSRLVTLGGFQLTGSSPKILLVALAYVELVPLQSPPNLK